MIPMKQQEENVKTYIKYFQSIIVIDLKYQHVIYRFQKATLSIFKSVDRHIVFVVDNIVKWEMFVS